VNKAYKRIVGVAMLGMALVPVLALAQLTNPTPPVTGQQVGLVRITDLIRQVATFLIAVALIVAVIFILWGGIMYMAAGSDESKATAAKDRIKNGVIGAAVVLAVGLILSTVAQIINSANFTF